MKAVKVVNEAWEFDDALATEELTRHFGVLSLEGFGLGPADVATIPGWAPPSAAVAHSAHRRHGGRTAGRRQGGNYRHRGEQ